MINQTVSNIPILSLVRNIQQYKYTFIFLRAKHKQLHTDNALGYIYITHQNSVTK